METRLKSYNWLAKRKTYQYVIYSYNISSCIYIYLQPPNSLTIFLQSGRRKVHRVLGDGNCMFRSISHQLFATPNKHFEVHSLLVRFESKNSHIFSPLLTEINAPGMIRHIAQMLQSGVWGTHVEVLAAAIYFQIPVYILKASQNQNRWEVFRPPGPMQNFKYQLYPEIDIEGEDFNTL